MNDIQYRHYTDQWGVTEDYKKVRAYLVKLATLSGILPMTFARWDWMATHPCLQQENVNRMGIWEHNGEIVALAAMDCSVNDTFLSVLPGYEPLYPELIAHAEKFLTDPEEGTRLCIDNQDLAQQSAAAKAGYVATQDAEDYAIFRADECSTAYTLPEGYHITDMQKDHDLYRYGECMWKGFNHEQDGEGPYTPTPEAGALATAEFANPNSDASIKIAVVAPGGEFAAYCGMWYSPEAGYAVVEPVATMPEHRKKGVGRAAVLEGVRRCIQKGARLAIVGSNQSFYYHIGFRPFRRGTFWVKK